MLSEEEREALRKLLPPGVGEAPGQQLEARAQRRSTHTHAHAHEHASLQNPMSRDVRSG